MPASLADTREQGRPPQIRGWLEDTTIAQSLIIGLAPTFADMIWRTVFQDMSCMTPQQKKVENCPARNEHLHAPCASQVLPGRWTRCGAHSRHWDADDGVYVSIHHCCHVFAETLASYNSMLTYRPCALSQQVLDFEHVVFPSMGVSRWVLQATCKQPTRWP